MLRSLTVENYRSFVASTTVELRPITLLFGYNHAGKSALLRFLPLIAESATGRYPGPIALQSPPARGASFDDLCSRQGDRPGFEFTLVGDLADPRIEIAKCRYELRNAADTGQYVHEFDSIWRRSSGDVPLVFHAREAGQLRNAPRMKLTMAEGDTKHSATQIFNFHGLTPFMRSPSFVTPWIYEAFQLHAALLAELDENVQWLGAIRRPPPRRAELVAGATPPTKLAADGSGAAELLAHDQGGEVQRAVEAWFAGEKGDQRFVIQTHSENLLLALQLEIAEERLDPAKLGLYWIRQLEDGSSRAEALEVDADARIKGWPRGVFEEDSTLARELAEARMRRAER